MWKTLISKALICKAVALLSATVFTTALSTTAYGQAAPASIASYSEQIEELSAQLGPFDPSLAELYLQQGQLYSQQGNYNQAVQALTLALQVSRVNHGPLAPQQEPALRALVDIVEASGETEQAELLHLRLSDINNHQLNSDFSIADVSALLQSSHWHLARYNEFRSNIRLNNLRMALRLAKHSEHILSQHYDDKHLALTEPLQQIANSSFYLTVYHLNNLAFFGVHQGSFQQQLTEQVFQQGLKAHRRIVKILRHNEASAEQIAEAQIELGDYLQRLDLSQASQKAYQMAWKTLQAIDPMQPLASLFDEPVPLLETHHQDIASAQSLARIKAHVNAEGTTQHIEVLQTYPEKNNQVASAARNRAQSIRFRSAFEAGKAVPGTVEFNLPLGQLPQTLSNEDLPKETLPKAEP